MIPSIFTPWRIVTGKNDKVDFTINGNAGTATLREAYYDNITDLLDGITADIGGHILWTASPSQLSYSFDEVTGKIIFYSDNDKFDIRFNSSDLDISDELGFDPDGDTTEDSTKIADWPMNHYWTPNAMIADDSGTTQQGRDSLSVSFSGYHSHISSVTPFTRRKVSFSYLPGYRVLIDRESLTTTPITYRLAFENIQDDCKGVFRWHEDRADWDTGTYHYMTNNIEELEVEKQDKMGLLYSFTINMNTLSTADRLKMTNGVV